MPDHEKSTISNLTLLDFC